MLLAWVFVSLIVGRCSPKNDDENDGAMCDAEVLGRGQYPRTEPIDVVWAMK
jgi:hypothetical protein